MREKSVSLLALLLLSLQSLSAYNSSYQELSYPMQTDLADIWSERGGEGPNFTCGYVKVGENVTFSFKVSSPMYVRIVIVKPDGSEIEIMKNSQVFPGVIHKFYQVFVDPGMRVIKLIGGVSGNVLDYCTVHVVTSFTGGDVWTDAGGRGHGIEGGHFTSGTPFGVWLKLNVTAEVRLVLQDPRGRESTIFSGSLEREKSRRIILELNEVGNYTVKLMQGNRILDYCVISVIKPAEGYPPSIRISSISLNGNRVLVEGETVPGTPGEELKILWDWGDGFTEEGPFPRSHVYKQSGVYTIRIIAKQSDGLSANFTYTILIPPEEEVRATTTQLVENRTIIVENRTKQETLKEQEAYVGQEVLAFILGALASALVFLIASKFIKRSS
ncbi:MAG: PKD domain-containing protein [Candidatus Korarchaeum sp.]|nr:PKD domain-containing protein [Candidatus Korarchaeum sp.]MDW8035628.1 PKD domain-containing protein [Candidatus Korarchaeum sp.]